MAGSVEDVGEARKQRGLAPQVDRRKLRSLGFGFYGAALLLNALEKLSNEPQSVDGFVIVRWIFGGVGIAVLAVCVVLWISDLVVRKRRDSA